MSEIPTDVYREILRRVPVDSLCQFRIVCKTWRDIIDDPQFIKLHMQHVTGNDWIILFHKFKGTSNVFLLPLKHLISPKASLSAEWVYPTNTKVPTITPGVARIKNSVSYPTCNGLILITSPWRNFSWMIWNPFTGQSFKLPLCDEFPPDENNCRLNIGLGCVEASDDYKVVRITDSHTFIFSVNFGGWHTIQGLPSDYEYIADDRIGVFANGALHWNVIPEPTARGYYSPCIVALDLSKETYRKIQLPRKSDVKDSIYFLTWRLAELGGCLYGYATTKTEKFVLWMIDDYNGSDDKMWIKMMSLKLELTSRYCNIIPVAYLKAENRILLNISIRLAWYDLGKQCLSYLSIKVNPDEHGHQEADHYAKFPDFWFRYSKFQVIPASLIRLKSDQTSSQRKRKRAAKKFGLEVSINAPARGPT